MKSKRLSKIFYASPTTQVAEGLLGKYLVHSYRGKIYSDMISEVEVYDGFRDKASHAARGITPRNKVMYGKPGVWYVYLVYGMHNMLNIVTKEKGYPAAVLIRGVRGTSGPGRLTKTFHISRIYDGVEEKKSSGLWVEDRGVVVAKKDIIRTRRIGVAYAGNYWAKKPLRFLLKTKHESQKA